jgi:hypothetical protein
MIAYDDRLDVSVFLTDDERVVVYDGRTRNAWALSEPEQELQDWLPPGQYALAINVLRRFAVVPDSNERVQAASPHRPSARRER